jgi:hypothetical protein
MERQADGNHKRAAKAASRLLSRPLASDQNAIEHEKRIWPEPRHHICPDSGRPHKYDNSPVSDGSRNGSLENLWRNTYHR